eukprot:298855-Pleurochrysis_carterae.AAC.1
MLCRPQVNAHAGKGLVPKERVRVKELSVHFDHDKIFDYSHDLADCVVVWRTERAVQVISKFFKEFRVQGAKGRQGADAPYNGPNLHGEKCLCICRGKVPTGSTMFAEG